MKVLEWKAEKCYSRNLKKITISNHLLFSLFFFLWIKTIASIEEKKWKNPRAYKNPSPQKTSKRKSSQLRYWLIITKCLQNQSPWNLIKDQTTPESLSTPRNTLLFLSLIIEWTSLKQSLKQHGAITISQHRSFYFEQQRSWYVIYKIHYYFIKAPCYTNASFKLRLWYSLEDTVR